MLDPSLVVELTGALNQRQVAIGTALLDQAGDELARLAPGDPYGADLMLLVAQWVDVGYRDHRFLDTLLLKFPTIARRKLPVDDFLKLRMVEAFRALSIDEVDTAIDLLEFVLQAQRESPDAALVTLAHFWKGRAHRKKGEYEAAFRHIVYARELSQNLENGTLTAVIQIQESWLLFQRGLKKEAWLLLNRAEAVLKSTDHALALGNIESARGRIVRRAGEYTKALEHFDRAISIYSAAYPDHRNLARTLVNAA